MQIIIKRPNRPASARGPKISGPPRPAGRKPASHLLYTQKRCGNSTLPVSKSNSKSVILKAPKILRRM